MPLPTLRYSWLIKKGENLSSKEYLTYLLGIKLIFMFKLDTL